jgi:hypothetical protein
MEMEKTMLAAYCRPIKLKFQESTDVIKLRINRIAGTKFTTHKKPLQLLKEMPALKIANEGFYANAKVKFGINSRFEVQSTKELFAFQSAFIKQLIADNEAAIKESAAKKFEDRQNRNKRYKRSN